MGELRKLVPRAASYVWETDYFEPNWQDSFWGDNYARLKRVKQKYDPDGFTWAAAMITSKLVSGSRKLPIWAARSA